MPKCRIGCSGFLYESWRGTFYPEDLPPKGWLSFYIEHFNTVELNVTFYRLLKKEAFERWFTETPQNFCFSLKGSRLITHIKKFKDVELPLLTFFNTTSPLLEKFEVVLWQLPPNFRANLKVLSDFIQMIHPYHVRHVFEFRHKSWINKKVFKLLEDSNMAICMADWPEFNNELPLTADFVYIRRHGEIGNYTKHYTSEQLKRDAKRIKDYLKQDKDVYIYFNNDNLGYAPKNAHELSDILKKTLPANLKRALTEIKEEKPRKAKSIKPKPSKKKKVSKKIIKKPKKKKPAKKLKPRKKAKTKITSRKRKIRKISKKLIKKPLRKKRIKGRVKKKPSKKITRKKTAQKHATKKPVKKSRPSKKKRR
jgi:uncharacterized protein YecE (DUF72 family)